MQQGKPEVWTPNFKWKDDIEKLLTFFPICILITNIYTGLVSFLELSY